MKIHKSNLDGGPFTLCGKDFGKMKWLEFKMPPTKRLWKSVTCLNCLKRKRRG